MLARVSGGNSGIEDYLEFGEKKGRTHSRDELDERLILEGDLATLRHAISNIETDAERYLHITLSFKEDHIPEETLYAINHEFRQFAMAAYLDDEYYYYSEAHLPKIKTLTNQRTGELIERKPHIHVVIPESNRLTAKRLEPFGLVRNTEHYIDAFQEVINEKYGLASPKMNLRTHFNHESEIISRVKGDLFEGQGKNLKDQAFKMLNDQPQIRSLEAFSRALENEGFEVRTRNANSDDSYLNIKKSDAKKGINLKEPVFRQDFLSKSNDERQKVLSTPNPNAYVTLNQTAYRATSKHHQDLKDWHKYRADQVRYINDGNRRHYKVLSTQEQRQLFLQQKKEQRDGEYQRRTRTDQANNPTEPRSTADNLSTITDRLKQSEHHLANLGRHRRELESGIREYHARRYIRAATTHIQQHRADQGDFVLPVTHRRPHRIDELNQRIGNHRERALISEPDLRQVKRDMDATALLKSLSQSHGVIVDKYPVTHTRQGDRIQCGNRQYNVTDFLTKEMHLTWHESRQIVIDEFNRQNHLEITPVLSTPWQHQLQSEHRRRNEIAQTLKKTTATLYQNKLQSYQQRKTDISIATVNKVLSDMTLNREIKRERYLLSNKITPYKDNIMSEERIGKFVEFGEEVLTQKGKTPDPKAKPTPYIKVNNDGKEEKIFGARLRDLKKEHPTLKSGDDIVLSIELVKKTYKNPKTGEETEYKQKEFQLSQEKRVLGKILEYGKGELDINGKIRESYFVNIEHEGKQYKEWGVNLENTLSKSNVKVGDKINLSKKIETIFDGQNQRKVFVFDVKELTPAHEVAKKEIKPVVDPQEPTMAELNRHVKAMNVINTFLELREKGITSENIVKTDKGEKIEIDGKQKALQTVIKEVNPDLKSPDVYQKLKSIYHEQEGIKTESEFEMTPQKPEKKEPVIPESVQQNSPELTKKINKVADTIHQHQIEKEKEFEPKYHEFNGQGFGEIHYKKHDNGHITYFEKNPETQEDNTLLIDRGKNIKVVDKSERTIEMALLISMEKYGTQLDIKGSTQYKNKVIDVVAKNDLPISFADKEMMNKLNAAKLEYKEVENIITPTPQKQTQEVTQNIAQTQKVSTPKM